METANLPKVTRRVQAARKAFAKLKRLQAAGADPAELATETQGLVVLLTVC